MRGLLGARCGRPCRRRLRRLQRRDGCWGGEPVGGGFRRTLPVETLRSYRSAPVFSLLRRSLSGGSAATICTLASSVLSMGCIANLLYAGPTSRRLSQNAMRRQAYKGPQHRSNHVLVGSGARFLYLGADVFRDASVALVRASASRTRLSSASVLRSSASSSARADRRALRALRYCGVVSVGDVACVACARFRSLLPTENINVEGVRKCARSEVEALIG
jgi:hypothetical protein